MQNGTLEIYGVYDVIKMSLLFIHDCSMLILFMLSLCRKYLHLELELLPLDPESPWQLCGASVY